MKIRSIINYIALAIPFILGLAGLAFSDDDIYIVALVSTALTGAIQVIIALTMLPKHSSNLLYSYLALTALFFAAWYIVGEEIGLVAIPPALAIFLTYIIYIEDKKESPVEETIL